MFVYSFVCLSAVVDWYFFVCMLLVLLVLVLVLVPLVLFFFVVCIAGGNLLLWPLYHIALVEASVACHL